jgi:DNA invertase Pin-like site-specific DNA recombinase
MKLIAYYRVSTKRQGRSGLGLDGQRAAVEAFAKRNGGKIVAEYVEVESGKRNDRPELHKALGHARLAKATLVVAKLDRLARNVAFLSALMESKVDFRCCDNEHATPLTLHILAAVAESEARAISERTSVALRAAKRRGVLLGSAREGHWEGREHRRAAGLRKAVRAASEARSAAASDAYAFLLPDIRKWREAGETFEGIAGRLNCAGHATRAGLPFTPTAIYRLLARE